MILQRCVSRNVCCRHTTCLASDHPHHRDNVLCIPAVQLSGYMMTWDLVTKW